MSDYFLNVPSKGLVSPTSWGSRASIIGMIKKIMANYGSFIKTAAENSKLPASVIASFIAVESGGNPTAGGSGSATQGLMQWNRKFAKSFLEAEKKLGRLTPNEEEILAKYGIKFDASGKTRVINQSDLVKPELNIVIGSILLGQYVDGYYEAPKKDAGNFAIDSGKNLRLDRIISIYNAGAYGPIGKKARTGNYGSASEMAANVPEPTKSYIKKILGENGSMDVATKELASLFS